MTSVLKTYNANGELLNTTKATRAVTTPDIVDIKGQARLRVFHIDEAGHELAATEVKIANPGTPYETAAKEMRFPVVTRDGQRNWQFMARRERDNVGRFYVYAATLVDDPDYSFEDDVEEPEDPAVPLKMNRKCRQSRQWMNQMSRDNQELRCQKTQLSMCQRQTVDTHQRLNHKLIRTKLHSERRSSETLS